jgi:hypothetical protein
MTIKRQAAGCVYQHSAMRATMCAKVPAQKVIVHFLTGVRAEQVRVIKEPTETFASPKLRAVAQHRQHQRVKHVRAKERVVNAYAHAGGLGGAQRRPSGLSQALVRNRNPPRTMENQAKIPIFRNVLKRKLDAA